MKKTPKPMCWEKRYEKIGYCGGGGNGDVWKVRDKKTDMEIALKCLKCRKLRSDAKARFRREIKVASAKAKKIKGILPIIESSYEEYWYTMPLAKPIMEYMDSVDMSIVEIVDGIILLADALSLLHKEKIYHRDIKPQNILYHNGQFNLGDFGLVSIPDSNEDLTKTGKGLGAVFTIAPEMKRNPKQSDAGPADVYSLAKTLWMLLCKDIKGFDGVYQFLDKGHSLRYRLEYRNVHLVELEELLNKATQNAPEDRPTMEEFRNALIHWRNVHKNCKTSQISDWAFLQRLLFSSHIPTCACWSEVDSIVDILNLITSVPAFNHMMMPNGGGLDFYAAERTVEEGCISIYAHDGDSDPIVVKPNKLWCSNYENDQQWNFFFLQLDELEPVGEPEEQMRKEYLVEDTPGHYVYTPDEVYGVYDYDTGIPLPAGYRSVIRYLNGNILFVLKEGPYNRIPYTYDGRQSEMSYWEFQKHVDGLRTLFNKLRKTGASEQQILRSSGFGKFRGREQKRYEEELEMEVKNGVKKESSLLLQCKDLDFSSVLSRKTTKNRASFYIKFVPYITYTGFDLPRKVVALCADGKLHELDETEISERAFLLYCREECFELCHKCVLLAEQYCDLEVTGSSFFQHHFDVHVLKECAPDRIFTRDEIEKAMRAADDRLNNTLVVDENGFVNILTDVKHPYAYPARLETWHSRHCYVGKYSSLSTLDKTYLLALEGWYRYLFSGCCVYRDYSEFGDDVEQLIEMIKELMQITHG